MSCPRNNEIPKSNWPVSILLRNTVYIKNIFVTNIGIFQLLKLFCYVNCVLNKILAIYFSYSIYIILFWSYLLKIKKSWEKRLECDGRHLGALEILWEPKTMIYNVIHFVLLFVHLTTNSFASSIAMNVWRKFLTYLRCILYYLSRVIYIMHHVKL